MHYLKCIALLDFLQKKLCVGQKQQVPVSVVDDVQKSMVSVKAMLESSPDPGQMNLIDDIMASIVSIKETPGLMNLTENMKNTLNDGLSELSSSVALKAFEFFKVNEFEPTKQIIPVMRTVVQTALEKGVL